MDKKQFFLKIKRIAKKNAELRKDPRFKTTVAFLVHKGFLESNEKLIRLGIKKISLKDAIWAGRIEPRILEVLPAAYARLPKSFNTDLNSLNKIEPSVQALKQNKMKGPSFEGFKYDSIKKWYLFPLKDNRTKTPNSQKRVKTFRLKPSVIKKLEKIAKIQNSTITETIENLVLNA